MSTTHDTNQDEPRDHEAEALDTYNDGKRSIQDLCPEGRRGFVDYCRKHGGVYFQYLADGAEGRPFTYPWQKP
jgi:hypothetical protein